MKVRRLDPHAPAPGDLFEHLGNSVDTDTETVFTRDMSETTESIQSTLEVGTAHVPGNATIHRACRFVGSRNEGWFITCGSSGTAGTRITVDPHGDPASINCGRCKR